MCINGKNYGFSSGEYAGKNINLQLTESKAVTIKS
jgi:hypothetical protein